eukprot:GHUV01056789.1.p1 GENE.GHUV01056789.1~~GHUV01056789.1.p1  ORF type:complete len:151 (-),score=14.72 GHUV01056789.1:168-620(-)
MVRGDGCLRNTGRAKQQGFSITVLAGLEAELGRVQIMPSSAAIRRATSVQQPTSWRGPVPCNAVARHILTICVRHSTRHVPEVGTLEPRHRTHASEVISITQQRPVVTESGVCCHLCRQQGKTVLQVESDSHISYLVCYKPTAAHREGAE